MYIYARLALAIRQFAMGESEFKLAKNYVKNALGLAKLAKENQFS